MQGHEESRLEGEGLWGDPWPSMGYRGEGIGQVWCKVRLKNHTKDLEAQGEGKVEGIQENGDAIRREDIEQLIRGINEGKVEER